MEIKIGDIIKTEAAREEFNKAYQRAFCFKVVPEIQDKIHQIAQEEIYKDKVSDIALRRRRPISSRLGSYNNIKVQGSFVSKTVFEIYYNDETKPQDPIKQDCTWYDDIFLIDLVSGTLKEGVTEGVIPNIFTYPHKYAWSAPLHRFYKQRVEQLMNSDEIKNLYQQEISKYPDVVAIIEKHFVLYVNELINTYNQRNHLK